MPTRSLLGRKKREYRWFVEPVDGGYTNQVIAQIVSEENLHMDKLCNDWVRRNLWEVPRRIIDMLECNMALRFKVFVQCGGGAVREWAFRSKRKKDEIRAHLNLRR